jgi:hypothetical protein
MIISLRDQTKKSSETAIAVVPLLLRLVKKKLFLWVMCWQTIEIFPFIQIEN